jgi:hypothetical protein
MSTVAGEKIVKMKIIVLEMRLFRLSDMVRILEKKKNKCTKFISYDLNKNSDDKKIDCIYCKY